jgi:hypothetical protein
VIAFPVSRIAPVNSQDSIVNLQPHAPPAQNALPEDTLTLSLAAQALQTEQRFLANAAQDRLSPAAASLQNEQKLAAMAEQNQPGAAGGNGAALWRATLALLQD